MDYTSADIIVRYASASAAGGRAASAAPPGVKALAGLALERVKSNESVEMAVARFNARDGESSHPLTCAPRRRRAPPA